MSANRVPHAEHLTELIGMVVRCGLDIFLLARPVLYPAFPHHQWHHFRKKPLCLTLVGSEVKNVLEML